MISAARSPNEAKPWILTCPAPPGIRFGEVAEVRASGTSTEHHHRNGRCACCEQPTYTGLNHLETPVLVPRRNPATPPCERYRKCAEGRGRIGPRLRSKQPTERLRPVAQRPSPKTGDRVATLIIGAVWRLDRSLDLTPAARVDVAVPMGSRRGNPYVSMTVLIGLGVRIGSAWRCTSLHASSSRRKIMVARSEIGVMVRAAG